MYSKDSDASENGQSSQYLGKKISAQGTSLVLEAWHLEIVALFRDEVEGWDEGLVAKRLFAIIVGEQRRKAGKVSRA